MTRLSLLALVLLAGCTTVAVRDEGFDPPPIPPELLALCEPPIMPDGPTFADIYANAISNAIGPWGRCYAKDAQLVAVVKYREEMVSKIKAERGKKKPWFQFWD